MRKLRPLAIGLAAVVSLLCGCSSAPPPVPMEPIPTTVLPPLESSSTYTSGVSTGTSSSPTKTQSSPTQSKKRPSSTSTRPAQKSVTMKDPRGVPRQIIISRGQSVFASAYLDAGHSDAQGVWQSAPHRASWLDEGGRPAPGVKNATLRSVITAHVNWSGKPDVFANLRDVKVGDRIVVTFDSGDLAIFAVTSPPRGFIKKQMVKEDSYWDVSRASRELTVITCDQSSVRRPDGHLSDNLALKATRVK